jgi:uncharacterized protein YecT (DUF1311 family)
MAMDNQSNSVLTEDLLAAAERAWLTARANEAGTTLYDGGSGASAGMRHGWSAKEIKKWLT